MRSAPKQGKNQHGAVAGPQDNLEDLGWGLLLQVGHLQRSAFTCGLTDAGVSNADASLLQRRDQLFVRAVGGALPEFVCGLFVVIDRARVGVGQLYGLADDGVQDLMQVERGVHRLAHLAERT